MSKKDSANGKQLGIQLIADYQSVLIAVATSQLAKEEARDSESRINSELSGFSRGGYLNTGGIEESLEKTMSRDSLNAHVKRIQADQIKNLTDAQIAAMTKEDKDKYVGRMVEVKSVKESESPFDYMYFDPQTGYSSKPYSKPILKGKIKDILFTKNVLLIDPSNFSKFMKTGLDSYAVYIINPETTESMVEISFL